MRFVSVSVFVVCSFSAGVAFAQKPLVPSPVPVPSVEENAPLRGPETYSSVGASMLVAGIVAEDGEQGHLTAPSIALSLGAGRRFADLHVLGVDLSVSIGPGPVVHIDGDTDQVEGASFTRTTFGLAYTRHARPEEGRFVRLALGASFSILESSGEDVLYAGLGGFARFELGRDWAVGRGITRIGFAGRVQMETYRTLGVDERMRGTSLSIALTITRSAVGVGRTSNDEAHKAPATFAVASRNEPVRRPQRTRSPLASNGAARRRAR